MTNKSTPSALNIINAYIHGTIDNQRDVSERSTTPCVFHAFHTLDVIEAYLEAYTTAGGDVSTIPVGTRLAETMVGMVSWLCDLDYYRSFDLDESRMDALSDVLARANSIACIVGEEDYAADLCMRWNAFMVQAEEL